MTEAYSQGLAAVIEFNCNILIVLTVITIICHWFEMESEKGFLGVITYLMDRVYSPIKSLVQIVGGDVKIVPYCFLGLLVPLQVILVSTFRNI